MTYVKTTWVDELPASLPVKYKLTDDTDGVIANSTKIELVTSVTSGTPVNASNLNHLETGVYNAQTAADAAQATANTALANASTAQATATAAQATADEALSAVTDPTTLLHLVYPVGCIYTSVVATNPSTVFGFGTWEAFGAGRVLVGFDSTQLEFDTVADIGGEKTHTLTSDEMPSHGHTQNSHTHAQDAHNHTQNAHDHTTGASSIERSYPSGVRNDMLLGGTPPNMGGATGSSTATNVAAAATNQDATATNLSTGGGTSHNNLQPFIVVYFWKRTV